MKVTVKRPFLHDGKVVREDDVIEVSENRARELEQNNLIVSSTSASRSKPVSGQPDPTMPRPTGGRTGAAIPVSSSPPDRPRKTRTYRRRKATQK